MTLPKNIGRYEIVDELGHGAMGSVFRARDPAMDRIVAVKTILAGVLGGEQGTEFRQRFYREAKAAGALAHPGIVPVFDVGEDEGMPFLVMEYVDGRTLADAMKKGERASLDRVCEIGKMVADALGYAHSRGVIHRDIKPANILLTSRQVYGEERPKITDFGVAKLAAGEVTTSGQLLGTPAFMPPEQFTGAPIDGRTDLFSLGVILYWMATGEQPFPGETMTAVSYKIVHTEPVPPGKLNPAIPVQLQAVILKCLAKNPADRYQTGEELSRTLAEFRTSAKDGSLQNPDAQFGAGVASEETFLPTSSFPPKPAQGATFASTLQPPQAVTQAKPPASSKVRGRVELAIVALLVAGALGGGYWLLHRNQPAQSPPPPTDAAAVALAPTAPPPAGAKQTQALQTQPDRTAIPRTAKKPEAGTPAGAAPPSAPIIAQAPAQAPKLAPVAFDPKKLDPKQNTRLRFDFEHFPQTATFSVEMNGKFFYAGPIANKSEYDSLYAPPGVNEVRVAVNSGGVQKVSNIVSADFIAHKRMTMRIDLRPGPSQSVRPTPVMDAGSQIVATLKTDFFSF
jgi:serine/threonine-protein kinase